MPSSYAFFILLDPGTTLGPYTILELLGVGGMGEVYRARDERLHRDVAVKVLPSHLAEDRAALERFRREARAVAALSHPSIVSIFDFGEENGVQYAVTEYLEGETLRARLGRGRFAAREALELLRDIADGVAAAHARGIVHRDLKPENIFLTTDGRVKVLDFGLARRDHSLFSAVDPSITEVIPTEPGVVMGTIGYIAPEQIEGRLPTPATDIFSLGCILYELIAGTGPFQRQSAAHAMVALLHDPAPRLEKSGDPFRRQADLLIQRCLEKAPFERPPDAGALAAEIRAVLEGRAPSRRLAGGLKPAAPRLLLLAIVVLLVLVGMWAVLRDRNRQLDHGYDLRAADVRGDRETQRLIGLALRADAAGNRGKAAELLEEAWRRPARTALPAAFLSSFSDAAGNKPQATEWARAAMARLPGAGTYESLLVRYLVLISDEQPAKELALAKSAIEVRPNAWRLRLAAAHLLLGQRDNAAALRELQGIDPSKPDDRRLMFVLADRASLGDVAGATHDLRASRLVRLPPLLHYTEARIAWSRGDVRAARTLYDRAAAEAAAESSAQVEVESRMLSGVCHLRLGDWAAAQRSFSVAGARARQGGLMYRAFQCAALAAYTADRAGDAEERDRKLADAFAMAGEPSNGAVVRLLAMRLRSPVWTRLAKTPVTDEPGTDSLLAAREAWLAGDLAGARRQLRRAQSEGIETTGQREEAELLAAELGLPSQILPPDPPYPNLVRYAAIFDLQRMVTGTGAER